MDCFERLRAAIEGKPVDRVPVGAWGHFYDMETTAEDLAEIMVSFHREYDWDFLKIHARASYHVEGFGFTYQPSGDRAKLHTCTGHPISSVEDWRKLRPLSLDHPVLQEQLKAVELIREGVGGEAPIIMTVFTPLDIAEKLVDRDAAILLDHIRQDPEAVEHGLSVFADTFAPFVRKLANSGIDGIYFSSKWLNKLSADQYHKLARPYDLRLINEAQGLWCNFFHLCEGDIDPSVVADYPVQVFHWDANAVGNPGYEQGLGKVGEAAVGGGVDAKRLADGTPEDVEKQAMSWIEKTGGRRFVLGPGCSIITSRTPRENLLALKSASEKAA